MTRLNGRLLVQRVDDLLVIMDEQAGAEITFDPSMRTRLRLTIALLFPEESTPVRGVDAAEGAGARRRDPLD